MAGNSKHSPSGETDGARGEDLWLTLDEVDVFKANPDAFAAAYYSLTVDEYREWIALEGKALCGAKTKRGRECRAVIRGGHHCGSVEWKRLHRQWYCHAHAAEFGAKT